MRANGIGEACGKTCRCHWTGRSMPPTKRHPPLPPGAASDCPPKPSFIEPHTGLRVAGTNGPIRGAMGGLTAGGETSAETDGIRFPSRRLRWETAHSECLNWSATDGSGRRRPSNHFPDSNPLHVIPDTRLASLTAHIMCSREPPLERTLACCADRFATGSGPTSPMSTPDFGAWRFKMSRSQTMPTDTLHEFAVAVSDSLGKAGQRELPSMYLYDELGSAL